MAKEPISSNKSSLLDSFSRSLMSVNIVSPCFDLPALNIFGCILPDSRGLMKAIEGEVAKICVVEAYSSQNNVLRASAARNSREFSGSSIPQIKV